MPTESGGPEIPDRRRDQKPRLIAGAPKSPTDPQLLLDFANRLDAFVDAAEATTNWQIRDIPNRLREVAKRMLFRQERI